MPPPSAPLPAPPSVVPSPGDLAAGPSVRGRSGLASGGSSSVAAPVQPAAPLVQASLPALPSPVEARVLPAAPVATPAAPGVAMLPSADGASRSTGCPHLAAEDVCALVAPPAGAPLPLVGPPPPPRLPSTPFSASTSLPPGDLRAPSIPAAGGAPASLSPVPPASPPCHISGLPPTEGRHVFGHFDTLSRAGDFPSLLPSAAQVPPLTTAPFPSQNHFPTATSPYLDGTRGKNGPLFLPNAQAPPTELPASPPLLCGATPAA